MTDSAYCAILMCMVRGIVYIPYSAIFLRRIIFADRVVGTYTVQ